MSRQDERPHYEQRGEAGDDRFEATRRGIERTREPVEQERKQDEEGDVDVAHQPLAEARRLFRDHAPDEDDHAERSERKSGPERSAVLSQEPLPDRDQPERGERYEVRVLE